VRSTGVVDYSKSLMYRRGAVGSGALGVLLIVVGIIFYASKHPNRGLACVIVGALLLIVGIALAVVERRARRGRPW
jgi:uncharacterized membrane protein HdeD (DUF308 family)